MNRCMYKKMINYSKINKGNPHQLPNIITISKRKYLSSFFVVSSGVSAVQNGYSVHSETFCNHTQIDMHYYIADILLLLFPYMLHVFGMCSRNSSCSLKLVLSELHALEFVSDIYSSACA